MKTIIEYKLVLSLLGNKANSWSVETFNSPEEAERYWEREYKYRNVGDGYDDYWKKVPLRIQQVITNDCW